MPGTEKSSQQRPAAPALVLLDSAFRPACYNAEATRILIYPRDPEEIDPARGQLEIRLHPILNALRASPPTPLPLLQSGRRQYRPRVFALNGHRKASSRNASYPAHALLLERQDRKVVDLSAVAEQFRLTRREQETLRLLTEGMTSMEIGIRMGISPHTVKAFFRLIMSKMQVSSRSGIIGKIVRLSH